MPATIVSETTLTLFSHDSCTYTVPAGVPTDIEDKFVPDAVKRGCSFHTAGNVPEPEPKLPIDQAIIQLTAEGDPKNFNALNGLPKVGAVSDLVGEKVTSRKIQEVWDSLGLTPEKPPKEDS